jgi:hypothetical protein
MTIIYFKMMTLQFKKVKVKFTLELAMQAQRGERGIALLIL